MGGNSSFFISSKGDYFYYFFFCYVIYWNKMVFNGDMYIVEFYIIFKIIK